MSRKKKSPHKTEEDTKETEKREENIQTIEVKVKERPEEEIQEEAVETEGEEEIARLVQEKEEQHDRLLRVQADFDNYRKRIQKEQANLLKYGAENALREILPVIDHIELAVDSACAHDNSDSQLREGVEMILSQFFNVLEKMGVRPIETVDHPFDPNKHDAMLRVHAPDAEEGAVMSEIRKGYYLHDKVLRPAQVTVGTREQMQATEEQAEERSDEPEGA